MDNRIAGVIGAVQLPPVSLANQAKLSKAGEALKACL